MELEHLLRVRSYALNNFSERNIRPGRPLATIEEVLVPIYLLHRYQIQAVSKLIGGQYFNYNMRGDGQSLPVTVDAQKQQAAINALLETIEPRMLALPQSLVDIIPPRPPAFALGRESFNRSTGNIFDPLSPATSAISLTLNVMLNRQRAARMNTFHAADPTLPGFTTILDSLNNASWYEQQLTAVPGAIQRLTNEQILHAQMALATDSKATPQVRSQALLSIQELDQWLGKQRKSRQDSDWNAHYAKARREIKLWLEDPSNLTLQMQKPVPPGSPIGN